MASDALSDQETGQGSNSEKSLLWLLDDVLIKTLINLTLEERIRIERTSKRIKAILDQILSLQKIFAVRPRYKKSVLMKSWSPLQSPVPCSKSRLFFDTLPWRQRILSASVLSRCSSVKLVNLEDADVRGIYLATWCPLITHFVTDKVAKAADYVVALIRNKKDVLIESFEYLPLSAEPLAVFRFLSYCPRLKSVHVIAPRVPPEYYNIPPDVLSKVKILSVFVNDAAHMDKIIKRCSKNVEQLTVRCEHVQIIADNFRNLVHLETHMAIQDFEHLIKLRKIQSINARASYLVPENFAIFEQFLSRTGSKLKYLRIRGCKDDLINRALLSLSANCPNLICFHTEDGIQLEEIELDTIKSLPQLEKINLDIRALSGSHQEVEKVNELLLRCKNSIRKVSLASRGNKIFKTISLKQLGGITRILSGHNCKSLSWIKVNGKKWNGSSEGLNAFCDKISFYYCNKYKK